MKNNTNDTTIITSRTQVNQKAMKAMAVELDKDPLFATGSRPRRRKSPRYAKQIMNDSFITNC